MDRLPVVLVVVALAGLLLDALSTHWNVRRYGLESEGNPALRSSMDRNGLGVALAWYGATRVVALASSLPFHGSCSESPGSFLRVKPAMSEGQCSRSRRHRPPSAPSSGGGRGWRTYSGL
jgi:hypothetical protein